MDTGSYRTDYWQGREVMPGSSMRFVSNRSTPKITRENLGGDYAPLFDRDKAGNIKKPRPHRAGDEDYSVGAYLTGGDKRELGKLLDALNRRTRRARRGRR